jgi:hypothetical protein
MLIAGKTSLIVKNEGTGINTLICPFHIYTCHFNLSAKHILYKQSVDERIKPSHQHVCKYGIVLRVVANYCFHYNRNPLLQ